MGGRVQKERRREEAEGGERRGRLMENVSLGNRSREESRGREAPAECFTFKKNAHLWFTLILSRSKNSYLLHKSFHLSARITDDFLWTFEPPFHNKWHFRSP